MNGMRKWLGTLISALALAAISLPTIAAPAKLFGLDMSPSTATTAAVTLTAKYSNLTPNGNSVINTVILTPPAGVTVTGTSFPNGGNKVTCPATTVNSLGQTVPVPANSICVANLPSVAKAGCSPVACSYSFNVTATLASSCNTYTWAGQAFAGNSFNGDTFEFRIANSSVTTTIGTQCPHKITSSAGSGGSIAPLGATTVAWDGSQTYTITPNSGFYISDVKVDGGSVGAVASYQFTMVEADHTIAATFAAKSLTIGSAPTSAVVGVPFDVVVGETPGGPIPTYTSTCATASTTDTTTPRTSTTFSVTISSLGACTITFSVGDWAPAPLTLTAYKGQIACGDYDSSFGPPDQVTKLLDPYSTSAYAVPGGSGWGLRRGPNKDGSNCSIKVNYTCDLDGATAIANCSWDKTTAQGQLATFAYVFVWKEVSPDANGWKNYQPLVSWGIASPGTPVPYDPTNTGSFNYNWTTALACIDEIYPAAVAGNPATYPDTIFPAIPSVAPFTDSGNAPGTYPQYQPTVKAGVCVGQQGSTSVGNPGGPVKLQFWHKVNDYADVLVKGPS